MTELLTESFCERCGTRYTFETVGRGRSLHGLRVLSKGFRNLVMTDDISLDEAMAVARSEERQAVANRQLDAFHRTFEFCMSCRQYTCADCWNSAELRCLSCAPLPGQEEAARAIESVPPRGDPMRASADAAAVAAEMIGAEYVEPAIRYVEPEPRYMAPEPRYVEPEPRYAPTESLQAPDSLETTAPFETAREASPEPAAPLTGSPAEPIPTPEPATEPSPEPDRTPEPETAPEPPIEPEFTPEPIPEFQPEPPAEFRAAPEEPVASVASDEPLAASAQPEPSAAAAAPEPVALAAQPETVAAVAPPLERRVEAELTPEELEEIEAATKRAAARRSRAPKATPAPAVELLPEAIAPAAPPARPLAAPHTAEPSTVPTEPTAIPAPTAPIAAPPAAPTPATTLAPAAAASAQPRRTPTPSVPSSGAPSRPLQRPTTGMGIARSKPLPSWIQAAAGGGIWEASAREVLVRPEDTVRPCSSCSLPLAPTARFCRRCGTRQEQATA